MYKKLCIILVAFCCVFCSQSVRAYNPETFPDVLEEYCNDVHLLKELNIISGFEDGTFRGDLPVTRAEFATLVYNIIVDDPGFGKVDWSHFSDVTPEDWFCTAVTVCMNTRVIHGYGDGTFRPGNYITVKEAGIMCVNLLGLEIYAHKYGYSCGYDLDYGYNYVIDKLDICNIGKTDDEYITRYDAAGILANVMDIGIYPEACDYWKIEDLYATRFDYKDVLKISDADVSYDDGKYVISGTYRIPETVETDMFKFGFDENLSEFVNEKVDAYVKADGENYRLIQVRKAEGKNGYIAFMSVFSPNAYEIIRDGNRTDKIYEKINDKKGTSPFVR